MGDEMSKNVLPDGTVTFLFTDIEGSTRLWQERPDEMQQALAQHDETLRSAIAENNGYVFATGGDGFAAAFPLVSDAIEAACVAQVGLVEHPFLRVRMGLHTGEAQLREGDYFGAAVNKAARIMSAGHGGQTLMSATTVSLVEGHPVKNLGEHRLRDLEGESVIWQLGTDDFAPLRTLDRLPGNLPVQRTSFIGRNDEVKAIGESVSESRLVTLVGPGGVGKSRLALQVAAELSADFAGGVWFASLGSLSEPHLVANALVAELELGERRGETAEEILVDWFGAGDVLLVIDNCEHLLDAVAAVVDHLLDVDAASRLVATSQASLSVPGEVVHTVEPLAAAGSAGESVQLFVERASAVRSGFRLTDDNEDAILEICDRLDHLPLAIELAASRVKAMSPADIAKRLDMRFRLLASSDRGAPGRQRTLEAAMRWSYELLEDNQQVVLRRLSVFVAPFTLEAAEAIVADDEVVEPWEVLEALLVLVDKSLLIARDHGDTTRYHLLESVRQFGRGELEVDEDLAHRSARYIDHYSGLIRDRGAMLMTARDQEGLAELDREWEHVRVALRAAADDEDSARFDELLECLAPMFLYRGLEGEGVLWASELFDRPTIDAAQRLLNLGSGAVYANNVDMSKTEALIGEAARVQVENDLPSSPLIASIEGVAAMMQGDNETAMECADEVFAVVDATTWTTWEQFQALTSAFAVVCIIGQLDGLAEQRTAYMESVEGNGVVWMQLSAASSFSPIIHELDPAGALDYLSRNLELAESVRNYQIAVHLAMFEGLQHLRTGDMSAASASLAKATQLAATYNPSYLGQNANAAIAIVVRDWPRASAFLLGGLEHWRRDRNQAGSTLEADAERVYAERLKRVLGNDFEREYQRGQAMNEDELVNALLTALRAVKDGTMSDDLLTDVVASSGG